MAVPTMATSTSLAGPVAHDDEFADDEGPRGPRGANGRHHRRNSSSTSSHGSHHHHRAAMAKRGPRVSRLVASFLRVSLLPVIFIGIPLWPILGLLCAVPVIGIITIPLFIFTTALLLYSVAWFSYLVLAQADPPASAQQGSLAPYLPFLPFSPLRCLKINWAAFLYASTALKIIVPAILDWSYRRVMVLGTQGGGGGIVKENIIYGSPSPNKRLDVYLPPSPNAGVARGPSGSVPLRHRKHSTHFAEPAAAAASAQESHSASPADDETSSAPVVVILPSPIPPLMWTRNRKTYLQLALRLRRMGYCVVVPDITTYPEGRVDASVVDLRVVLRWVAQNCHRYGGDERRIYLLGHGMSAHLAMLTLTQEAVVFSREGFLHREESLSFKKDPNASTTSAGTPSHAQRRSRATGMPFSDRDVPDESAWVDEPSEEELPPGAVMAEDETLDGFTQSRHRGLAGLQRVSEDGAHLHEKMPAASSVAFPGSTSEQSRLPTPARRQADANGTSSTRSSASAGISESISNGLRRVEIYEPEIEVPPVAGVILLAGVFDVIKCFRKESDRGVEHLSVLRRSCGPSHTLCLLHSPAHLLYAAKNVIDTSLLPPRFLLIHGGKDAVVDISQSTLLKTLLSGIGMDGVKLRAYRELGHAEAIASLFLGMGKASTRYSKQILQDIGDFVAG